MFHRLSLSTLPTFTHSSEDLDTQVSWTDLLYEMLKMQGKMNYCHTLCLFEQDTKINLGSQKQSKFKNMTFSGGKLLAMWANEFWTSNRPQ